MKIVSENRFSGKTYFYTIASSKANMTLADLAFMATYSTLRASKLVDHKSFWYVEAWFKRCKNQVREEDEVERQF